MADADQLYQDALNQINSVNTPDINQMKIKLQGLVQQGLITPEQMQTALVDKNAYNSIVTNPQYTAAQQGALSQMQNIADSGGLDAIDKAQLQDIQDQQATALKGQEGAIMSNLQERGAAGGGMELQAKMAAAQAAGDTASKAGLDVAAQAEQRALQSIQNSSDMATNLRSQDYNEQAQKAGAQNAIDEANAQMTNQGRAMNVQNNNAAQAANLAEKQNVADTNVNTKNQETEYNAQLPEEQFQNQMQKAGAAANEYNQWAGTDAKKQAAKTGFQNGLTAGLIQTGAKAAAGANAGSFAPANASSYDESAPANYNPGGSYNQTVAGLGYSKGGKVPGTPNVPGNSPMNDTVPAKLSPGEVVVPRTAAENPNMLKDFVSNMEGKPKAPKPPKVKSQVDHHDIAKVFKALAEMKGGK